MGSPVTSTCVPSLAAGVAACMGGGGGGGMETGLKCASRKVLGLCMGGGTWLPSD